jgi:hypothetical protein
MTKITKMFLGVSLVGFALGFTGVLWGIGTPVGAIFFGLFLISKLLEKEAALFDEECQQRLVHAEREKTSAPRPLTNVAEEAFAPSRLGAARSA